MPYSCEPINFPEIKGCGSSNLNFDLHRITDLLAKYENGKVKIAAVRNGLKKKYVMKHFDMFVISEVTEAEFDEILEKAKKGEYFALDLRRI